MAEDRELKKTPVWRWLLLGFATVAVLWGGSLFCVLKYGDITDTGTFGDSFGAVNALFSGLAFAGVIVAILLQKRELELQREELSETRKEAARLSTASEGQQEQLEQQNQSLVRQAAQTQFFQILASWDRIVQDTQLSPIYDKRPDVSLSSSKAILTGRDAFQAMAYPLEELELPDLEIFKREELAKEIFHTAREMYEGVYEYCADQLGHCFRLLYNAVKIVHEEQAFDCNTKYSLIRILRAHLSQSELLLLMFNGISDHGQGFYPLIEKYDLLQNLDSNVFSSPEYLLMYPRRSIQELRQTGHLEERDYWRRYAPFHIYEMPDNCLDDDIRAVVEPMPGFPLPITK